MHRVIWNLRWAALTNDKPPSFVAAQKKLRGAALEGIRYQARVKKWLVGRGMNPVSDQGFNYVDDNGKGWAQTDQYIVIPGHHILLIECKLTQTNTAYLQMMQLYFPLLEYVYKLPVVMLQVCKHMRHKTDAQKSPEELLAKPVLGNFVCHYRGELT